MQRYSYLYHVVGNRDKLFNLLNNNIEDSKTYSNIILKGDSITLLEEHFD